MRIVMQTVPLSQNSRDRSVKRIPLPNGTRFWMYKIGWFGGAFQAHLAHDVQDLYKPR